MSVFKVIVVRQVTERVWVEIPGVETPEEAIVAYKEGEGCEVHHQFLATNSAQIEEVYQERQAKGGNGNGASSG